MTNHLYYGDNFQVLREHIESLIENYTFGRLLNHNFMIYMTNTGVTSRALRLGNQQVTKAKKR